MRTVILGWILISAGFGSSCTSKSKGASVIRLEMSSQSARSSVASPLTSFNCILLNVTANDIAETAPFGIFSGLVPISNGGVASVVVPDGLSRTIQILGVESNVGCSGNITAASLASFTNYPEIFVISQTVADVYTDLNLDLNNQYDASTAVDVRTGTSPSSSPPSNACSGTAILQSDSGIYGPCYFATSTITITNNGTCPATFGTISLASVSDGSFTSEGDGVCTSVSVASTALTGTCTSGSTLGAGDSCTVILNPTAGCAATYACSLEGAGVLGSGVQIPYYNGSANVIVTSPSNGSILWGCNSC